MAAVLMLLTIGVVIATHGSEDPAVSSLGTTTTSESELRRRRDERAEQEAKAQEAQDQRDEQLSGPIDAIASSPTDGGYEFAGAWTDAPRFFGGLIVAPEARGVVAVNSMTGTVQWTNPDCPYGYWTSQVDFVQAPEAVLTCDGMTTGMRVEDGVILWQNEAVIASDRIRIGPSMILYSSDDPGDVVAVSLQTGEVVGRFPQASGASAVSDDSTIYISNDEMVQAIDVASGGPRWDLDKGSVNGLGVDQGRLFMRQRLGGSPSTVEAVQTADASSIWQGRGSGDHLVTSDFIGTTDAAVLIESYEATRYLTAFDKVTGSVLWSVEPDGAQYAGGGTELATSVETSSQALSVLDGASGRVLATFIDAAPMRATSSGRVVAYISGVGSATSLRVVVVP